MVEVFDNTDDTRGEKAYVEWLRHHRRDGYVLNRRRGNTRNYLFLHYSECDDISKYKGKRTPGCFTENDYIKVCADNIDDLKDYIRAEVGRDDFTHRCEHCNPV